MMTIGEVLEILTKIFNALVEIFGGLFGSSEDGEAEEAPEENA